MTTQDNANQKANRGFAAAIGVLLGIAGLVWFVQTYAPTESVRGAAPAATQPTTIRLSGNSQTATQMFNLKPGLARFESEYSGKGNFIIWLMDSKGEKLDTVANAINTFKGSKAIQIKQAGGYLLNVSADGPWTVTVQQ